MQLTGDQLIFLIQVLQDSLKIERGYDWTFEHKRDKRNIFYEDLMRSLLTQSTVNIQGVELSRLQELGSPQK